MSKDGKPSALVLDMARGIIAAEGFYTQAAVSVAKALLAANDDINLLERGMMELTAQRAEVDTTDATRFRWIANPKSNWIVGPCLPDNAPMGCGEDWELDELRATVDAAMRDDMNGER